MTDIFRYFDTKIDLIKKIDEGDNMNQLRSGNVIFEKKTDLEIRGHIERYLRKEDSKRKAKLRIKVLKNKINIENLYIKDTYKILLNEILKNYCIYKNNFEFMNRHILTNKELEKIIKKLSAEVITIGKKQKDITSDQKKRLELLYSKILPEFKLDDKQYIKLINIFRSINIDKIIIDNNNNITKNRKNIIEISQLYNKIFYEIPRYSDIRSTDIYNKIKIVDKILSIVKDDIDYENYKKVLNIILFKISTDEPVLPEVSLLESNIITILERKLVGYSPQIIDLFKNYIMDLEKLLIDKNIIFKNIKNIMIELNEWIPGEDNLERISDTSILDFESDKIDPDVLVSRTAIGIFSLDPNKNIQKWLKVIYTQIVLYSLVISILLLDRNDFIIWDGPNSTPYNKFKENKYNDMSAKFHIIINIFRYNHEQLNKYYFKSIFDYNHEKVSEKNLLKIDIGPYIDEEVDDAYLISIFYFLKYHFRKNVKFISNDKFEDNDINHSGIGTLGICSKIMKIILRTNDDYAFSLDLDMQKLINDNRIKTDNIKANPDIWSNKYKKLSYEYEIDFLHKKHYYYKLKQLLYKKYINYKIKYNKFLVYNNGE